jgi:hypothetical protein
MGDDCLRLAGSNEKLTIDEITGQGPGPAPPFARSPH